jgi:hypothetical protein
MSAIIYSQKWQIVGADYQMENPTVTFVNCRDPSVPQRKFTIPTTPNFAKNAREKLGGIVDVEFSEGGDWMIGNSLRNAPMDAAA